MRNNPEKFNQSQILDSQQENKEERKKINIVIIDDSPDFADSLVELLAIDKSITVKAFYAYSDKDRAAAEYIQRVHPDIVLLDIYLGAMNYTGVEVGQDLRKEGYNGKIIIISGTTSKPTESDIKKCGADDFCAKWDIIQNLLTQIKLLRKC